ncbi:Type IV pilus biogenesis and competence protein pilQ precursor [Serratia entomophila]|jgi:protein transport protein HofQ|uniref:DNA uptake porin HofQ n=1 Tax=Serratia entomophila TaxID=42906 RepID=A0ABY5CS91_9GAMM|nr:DNA uptake porin HofQ [Serratia entomophila]UIW18518.1 DNA uptake porin HofQ [Serratia entomophila]USV00708.1 DNA uptake porin HofQ [Serratia entomophila]CAI0905052.1 Type IV pilus biogenesis and competence protein pilQ precursor [Serratia entomophila]CAI0981300.1 Type IV pilus biogenesis and competence protein pilQ precursor [Serratia entomophila]CAI0981492.1 Type IV pilus biogenesis and competence protein pilQ precursor [Serratia entomophila]
MKGCFWLGLSFWGLAAAACAQDSQAISLEFQDAPVTVILQALADYRQLNLIAAAGVNGNLTLRLDNVPWPQALALVLRMGKLAMTREGNVMLVAPEPDAQEKQQRLQALAQQQPLHSLSLTLQNADAAEVAEQAGALLGERGSLVVDKRTNALLIRDTAPVLALMKQRVAEMDRALAQVQLAAHIVTINSENLRDLGVRWGLAPDERAAKPLRLDNFSVGLPLEHSAVNAGFHLARLSGRLLSLELTALEQENQVEIIASPRLLTAHLQTASIKQGTEIPYEVSSGASGATSVEFKEAVLGMEVTPKVLPDGRITLTLHISQNMPGRSVSRGAGEALTIDKQEIKTQITVKDGETIVLGGIFQRHSGLAADKVPGIGDVPLLGSLFKQSSKQLKRRELVIFITPTLIKA